MGDASNSHSRFPPAGCGAPGHRAAAWCLLFGRHPRRTLVRIVVLVGCAIVVFGWMLVPLRLTGISMLPNLRPGTFAFANRAAYWFRAPARGDVVAIRVAGSRVFYVKRIVGLPGEHVAIVEGFVTIDGVALIEPAVARRARWTMAAETVGDGEYFVIGDNRSMALDHHDFGRVPRDRIVGPLLF